MAKLLSTVISSSESTLMFDAFMHGQCQGEFDIFTHVKTNTWFIQFENEEDATSFVLKGLDNLFMQRFSKATSSFRNRFNHYKSKIPNKPQDRINSFLLDIGYCNHVF